MAREHAVVLHGLLMAAGRDLGVTNAGHYAINSLRLEKGYCAWGADISPDDTPIEARLTFALSWKKMAVSYGGKKVIGSDALLAQRGALSGF